MTATETARPTPTLPLLGNACAICAHPARWVDSTRHVVHVDLRLRPCPLPPNPAAPTKAAAA
ncbi:hypothetical protein SAMN05216506_113169 [Saccharopolyspora kobensis]|uniref:Uncharacterized protein n=2 Tax=Bacteria TaxID=2 RepID=A0A1I4UJR4_9BURK|nr:hypothetical protein [Saccharopolyspora kobensis]SFE69236.1 hypothetical protein SAMN05216506_113169 [Saccharopolyspora kobensis]SFM88963.1 hypothetical protein SAMN02982985_05678 [Rugamonas rubra]